MTTEELSDNQLYIIEAIQKNPNITQDELAEDLLLDIGTVKRNIKALKEMGYLKRIGSARKGSWFIQKRK